jgi:hypothetical protein
MIKWVILKVGYYMRNIIRTTSVVIQRRHTLSHLIACHSRASVWQPFISWSSIWAKQAFQHGFYSLWVVLVINRSFVAAWPHILQTHFSTRMPTKVWILQSLCIALLQPLLSAEFAQFWYDTNRVMTEVGSVVCDRRHHLSSMYIWFASCLTTIYTQWYV